MPRFSLVVPLGYFGVDSESEFLLAVAVVATCLFPLPALFAVPYFLKNMHGTSCKCVLQYSRDAKTYVHTWRHLTLSPNKHA